MSSSLYSKAIDERGLTGAVDRVDAGTMGRDLVWICSEMRVGVDLIRGVGRDGGPRDALPFTVLSPPNLTSFDCEAGTSTLSTLSPSGKRFLTVYVPLGRAPLAVEGLANPGCRMREALVVADEETRGRCGVMRLGCRTSRTMVTDRTLARSLCYEFGPSNGHWL